MSSYSVAMKIFTVDAYPNGKKPVQPWRVSVLITYGRTDN